MAGIALDPDSLVGFTPMDSIRVFDVYLWSANTFHSSGSELWCCSSPINTKNQNPASEVRFFKIPRTFWLPLHPPYGWGCFGFRFTRGIYPYAQTAPNCRIRSTHGIEKRFETQTRAPTPISQCTQKPCIGCARILNKSQHYREEFVRPRISHSDLLSTQSDDHIPQSGTARVDISLTFFCLRVNKIPYRTTWWNPLTFWFPDLLFAYTNFKICRFVSSF